MKGKLAFVLGAAVGYILGARAGRERYEQIKRGAQRVWHTEPVQRGVHLVKDVVDDRADDLKAFAVRVGNDVFSSLAKNRARSDAGGQDARGPETAAARASTAERRPTSPAPDEQSASAPRAEQAAASGAKNASASGAKKAPPSGAKQAPAKASEAAAAKQAKASEKSADDAEAES